MRTKTKALTVLALVTMFTASTTAVNLSINWEQSGYGLSGISGYKDKITVGYENSVDIKYLSNGSTVSSYTDTAQYPSLYLIGLTEDSAYFTRGVNEGWTSDRSFNNLQQLSSSPEQSTIYTTVNNGGRYVTLGDTQVRTYDSQDNLLYNVSTQTDYVKGAVRGTNDSFALVSDSDDVEVYDTDGTLLNTINSGLAYQNGVHEMIEYNNGKIYVMEEFQDLDGITVVDETDGSVLNTLTLPKPSKDVVMSGLEVYGDTLYYTVPSTVSGDRALYGYDLNDNTLVYNSTAQGLTWNSHNYATIYSNGLSIAVKAGSYTKTLQYPNDNPSLNVNFTDSAQYDTEIDISYEASDNQGVERVNVTAYKNGDIERSEVYSQTEQTLTDFITTNDYADYNVTVEAYDIYGATNSTYKEYSVVNTRPNITSFDTEPSPVYEHDNITLQADVYDDKKVEYVEMRVRNVTGWVNASKSVLNQWEYADIITDANYTRYTYDVRAYDEYGLMDSQSFTESTVYVNDAPVIQSGYAYPNMVEIDDTIKLYLEGYDSDSPIANATYRIYFKEDTLVTNGELKYDKQTGLYEDENAFTVQQNGTYDVDFKLTDNASNTDTSTYEFSVGTENDTVVIEDDDEEKEKPKGFIGKVIDAIFGADMQTFFILVIIGVLFVGIVLED